MVVSPPFLPPRGANESEADWLERAMKPVIDKAREVDTERGSFPVGGYFMWHTGVHIVAPFDGHDALPVRAMADGIVVFASEPTPTSTDAAHPQNYARIPGLFWSDNGCVILRHDTEIGAQGTSPTTFSFYTLTMHLAQLDPAVRLGARVYRKEIIGRPGKIYGAPNTVHVEVCCDAAQLARLTGRPPAIYDLDPPRPPEMEGRKDSVFGDLVIYLPAQTAVVSEKRSVPQTPRNPDAATHIELGKAQWVTIRYQKGDSYINSLDMTGRKIGTELRDPDFEYELYAKACALHKAYAHGGNSTETTSPSGWYELLRFGRNLGTDPLPRNAAHWREIPTASGTIWADLNSPGSRKYSDADFMAITGWNFFDDDSDHLDQRCQSVQLRRRIRDPDPAAPGRETQEHLNQRLGNAEVRKKLRRSICYFPTEWDRSTIDQRHQWMRVPADGVPIGDEKWAAFEAHCKAMTFDKLPEDYKNAKWRFHPTEFVEVMRRCGWLSLAEISQTIPRTSKIEREIAWKDARGRYLVGVSNGRVVPPGMKNSLNRAFAKYGIAQQKLRLAHFLSQCYVETGLLSSVTEKGDDRYFRTMYEVITPDEAGADYDDVKGIAWRMGFVFHTVDGIRVLYTRDQYMAIRPVRLKKKSTELGNVQAGDGIRFKGRGLIQMTGRASYESYSLYRGVDYSNDPNPQLVASDAFVASDAAGKYWVNAGAFGGRSINRQADSGCSQVDVQHVTRAVNGGLTQLEIRQEMFDHGWSLLNDDIQLVSVRTRQRLE